LRTAAFWPFGGLRGRTLEYEGPAAAGGRAGRPLVGVVAQADIAREAKEKQTGALVEEISQP
jgi:hypothetical protein